MCNITHGQKIITESYDDGELRCTKQEYKVPVFSSKERIPFDIIEALVVLTSGKSRKLELSIKIDSKGRWVLEKRWPVED